MTRFLPKSLMGQTLLAAAAALLIAQIISASLLYRAAEQRRLDNIAERIVNRIEAGNFRAQFSQRSQQSPEQRAERRSDRRGADRRDGRMPRRFQFRFADELQITPSDKPIDTLEEPIREKLAQAFPQWGQNAAITVVLRSQQDDPLASRRGGPDHLERGGTRGFSRDLVVASVREDGAAQWLQARVRLPDNRPRPLPGILLQTGVLFTVLLGLLALVLRRITRPLAALTNRVDAFSQNPDQAVRLEESGPQDMRRLIAAHNAMEARVAALIDEKDVMLGAIGHDLKTPLAALRVRIESVPDDTQRARMADSIEDITHTLDDILSLARIGRSGVEAELTDIAALTASVAEEFEDLGDPVTLEAVERVTLPVHVTWLKRALRNLVSNAVRYGQTARVSLLSDGGAIVLRVDDDGPGIPEEAIADMLEPFQRGEASRNRSTGGAGLGLTLARAIAEQHGGTLSLTNRPKGSGEVGGLRAEIRLPANQAD
ncbi:MAG: ATP-binding protein [Marinomonas sp.]